MQPTLSTPGPPEGLEPSVIRSGSRRHVPAGPHGLLRPAFGVGYGVIGTTGVSGGAAVLDGAGQVVVRGVSAGGVPSVTS